jgi:hypothetical protein
MAETQSFGDMVAVRDVAGKYITELGAKSDKVVVVNADLMGTSRNAGFKEKYPDRAFNVGIAEQDLVSFSAGLAHEGFMPYAFTMAPFISMRACEQCRTDVAYGNLDVRLIGNYAGYSSGVSGATHCALEDCAIMGSMAGMTVLEPGDPYQICKMLEASLTYEGPIYIRSGIEALKPIYPNDYDYEIGKAIVAREGDDGRLRRERRRGPVRPRGGRADRARDRRQDPRRRHAHHQADRRRRRGRGCEDRSRHRGPGPQHHRRPGLLRGATASQRRASPRSSRSSDAPTTSCP